MAAGSHIARRPLSRSIIVDAALAKADREGLESVTFRRLAADLHVTPMALYRYVASKEELLHAISERAFEELELPLDDDIPWQYKLLELARSYRRILLEHPVLPALELAGLSAGSISGMRVVEILIGVLRDAGFSVMEAATLQCRLERFAFAIVLLETNVATPSGNPLQKARSAEARAFLATLPAAEFPHVCEAEEWLCNAVDPEWAFEFTLDLIIGGLEKLLERRPRGSDGEPVDESPPPPS